MARAENSSWWRASSNIEELQQFSAEEWAKLPVERCRKPTDGHKKHPLAVGKSYFKFKLIWEEIGRKIPRVTIFWATTVGVSNGAKETLPNNKGTWKLIYLCVYCTIYVSLKPNLNRAKSQLQMVVDITMFNAVQSPAVKRGTKQCGGNGESNWYCTCVSLWTHHL